MQSKESSTREYMEYLIEKYGASLTVDNVAEILGVSRRIVDNMIHAGSIPSMCVGKRHRIPVNKFIDWSNQQCRTNQTNTQLRLLKHIS